MRERNPFKTLSFLLLVTIILYTTFLVKCVRSEDFVVGDEDKWDSQGNYLSWSQKYNFSVGDVLVFEYVEGQHNVFEVEESTYQSCNSSVGVLSRHATGNDRIELTEARKYWFICDIVGHCLGGMRFRIGVGRSRNFIENIVPNGSSSGAPPPPVTLTRSSCDCLLSKGLGIWVLFVTFFVFLFTQVSIPL